MQPSKYAGFLILGPNPGSPRQISYSAQTVSWWMRRQKSAKILPIHALRVIEFKVSSALKGHPIFSLSGEKLHSNI